ncbi:MAG: acetylglutamate kinase [Candidatus Planktophila sp.]
MSTTLVVKFGGHAITDDSGLFAAAIGQGLEKGLKVVVVHGGGPQINAEIAARGITPEFVGGFRVTDQATLEAVEDVLINQVGPAIVKSLKSHSIPARAVSGRDVLKARKLDQLVDGSYVDLGFVGAVTSVDCEKIIQALDSSEVPVISPVASDQNRDGSLNINADLAAAAIAGALDAQSLIVMTDVAGIYRNWPDTDSLIDSISRDELFTIRDSFTEGMAPKVAACIEAIDNGARAVRVINGRDPHAFAKALENTGGTLVSA